MKKREKSPLAVKIIKSSRRKKTISAKIVGDELLLYLPTGLSEKEEKKWVDKIYPNHSKSFWNLVNQY